MKKLLCILLMMAALMPAGALNKLPQDPDVRIGTLPNGLTYYIRHNDVPEHRADFFIAQKVGSVNEDENQRGLAHFLEHMCFNGTRHFPGQSLITYLESLGVKFGANLNAYTSTDETVYNICEVPTARPSALDSCLLILRDWSHGLLLTDKDIDEERGVITGEWRQRQGTPFNRMLEKAAPRIFAGSKYGERLPIGKMDVITNFKYKELRDYYDKWYYPENQCVIVVGDVDPDAIEKEITRLWSDIKRPGHDASVTLPEIPANPEVIAVAERDPEQSMSMVQMYIKHPLVDKEDVNTVNELRAKTMGELVSGMMADRLDIVESNPDAPFSNLGIGDNMKFILARGQNALLIRYNAKATREAEAVAAVATELKRAATHGFTDTELARATVDMRSHLETQYNGRNKLTNTILARKYVRHYLDGGQLTSPEQYYKLMKGVLGHITLDDVNAYFKKVVGNGGENAVVVAYMNDNKNNTTTEAGLAEAYTSVDPSKLEAYVDKKIDGDILKKLPTPGSIVAEQPVDAFGSKVWTLSNGIKVHVKQTDFGTDQILIQGWSPGGISQNYDPKYASDYRILNDALGVSAYGPYTNSDLRRLLVGKNVKTIISVDNQEEKLGASTNKADLETAFKLLYLKATDIRPDRNAFRSLIENKKMKLTAPTTPTFVMGDSIHYLIYNSHPLGAKLSAKDLDAINYDHVLQLHKERFGDMGDFTFYIVGNFNEDTLRNYVCRYFASLPSAGRVEKGKDIGYRYTPGRDYRRFTMDMETPQTISYTFYHAPSEYNLRNVITGSILGSMIQSKLRQVLREERGWTYSVKSHIGISGGMNGADSPNCMMPAYIKVAPEHARETFDTVAEIAESFSDPANISAEEMAKVSSYMIKNAETMRTDNTYWLTVMHMYDKFGEDMYTSYIETAKSITPADVAAFAKDFFTKASRIQLEMSPTDK